uniref:Probable tRNA modification GTPase MnmE n=1 Tax=Cyanidium caldarium TaxID=2771 RepID=MNME_CYACA|nr:thiophen and furan oxidation protein [Cyanidium caldarium]Q9TLX6.1 RecName: Full=Probable tRNA modification GTPase MnmE [Cyanidium caldarium]AAF12952.1 unknown [Cyanidium caldarium]WDB00265.1 thiophen and furan oxidation protein [Cyanidium caldarium]
MYKRDTIAAIATCPNGGGVSILRLSGSKSIDVVKTVSLVSSNQCWHSHCILYGWIKDNEDQSFVDEVLILLMMAPRSYTAENVVEIHCHASIVLANEILRILVKQGVRLAKPGEFTMRAFLNGRIGLSQVESVLKVIHSKTIASAKLAANTLRRGGSERIRRLKHTLSLLLADLEFHIDFSDEFIDVDSIEDELRSTIQSSLLDIKDLISSYNKVSKLNEGTKVCIIGKPNVGKSSLLNAIAKRECSIVTNFPGTTRDIVSFETMLGNTLVRLYDTAGIRQSVDEIEKIGISKTELFVDECQIVFFVLDAIQGLSSEDSVIFNKLNLMNKNFVILINKIDKKVQRKIDEIYETLKCSNRRIIEVSAIKNIGLEKLNNCILDLSSKEDFDLPVHFSVNCKYLEILNNIYLILDELYTGSLNKSVTSYDFIAVELRRVLQGLNQITGDEVVENNVLDAIFSKFCVGK